MCRSAVKSGFPASHVPVYLKGAGEIKQAIRTASGSWVDLRVTKHSHGSKLTHLPRTKRHTAAVITRRSRWCCHCLLAYEHERCRVKADSGCSGFNTLVLILELNLSLQPTERFFLIPIQMLSAGRRAWTQCSVDSPRMSPCGHREQAGEQTSTQILTLTDYKASKVRLGHNL